MYTLPIVNPCNFKTVHAHLVHFIPKLDTNTKFTNCAVQFQNCTD